MTRVRDICLLWHSRKTNCNRYIIKLPYDIFIYKTWHIVTLEKEVAMMTVQTIIETNEWLQDLFKNSSSSFLSRMEYSILPTGKTIIKKGVKNPYIFILVTGELRVLNEYDNGRRYSYAVKYAPGFMGLLELFAQKENATSTVMTQSESGCIKIRKKDFANWIESDFTIYKMVAQYFAKQMYPSINQFGTFGVYSNKKNMIKYLIGESQHALSSLEKIRIQQTREAMAEKLGMSLRTVYRVIEVIRSDRYCCLEKGKITITDKQLKLMEEYLENESE